MLEFENALALECGQWVQDRILTLAAAGYSVNEVDEQFSPELYLLSRIAMFPWNRYPDTTAPWHLIRYPHMRWEHVYHVAHIIEGLKQPTGSGLGQSIKLMPFQVMILLAFLGPENPETKLRKIREGALTIARKNAKTAIIAGLCVALMSLHPDDHGLKGQEIQVGASDREQAGITYTMCERMILMDTDVGISRKFRPTPSKKTIAHLNTLTQLRCLSSDAHRHHGGNPAMVLLDEIGNVPASQAEEFYSVLTTGFAAQREPLTLLFSTQAPNDQHMFSQVVDRAKRINEGMVREDEFAGFVFEVPEVDQNNEDIDPHDETLWYLANPGIGGFFNVEDMKSWSKKARELPNLENKYKNLKLNQRVSETSAFLTRTVWQRNDVGFTKEKLEGRRCTLGLDLSETTDLTALVAVFEPIDEDMDEPLECLGRMPVIPHFWIPGEGLQERCRADKVPYDVWVRQGLVNAESSHVVDYRLVAEKIVEYMDLYEVLAIGFDRHKMKYLRKELLTLGVEFYSKEEEDAFLIPIGQGFIGQSRSVQVLEEMAVQGKLAHAGNPVLRWNIANAVTVKDPAGNRKFEKAKSYGRIDGTVALAMAAHVYQDMELEDGESLYDDEERDVIM